ncbi:MAG: UvrD-helicase domain-containing protein, partial [Pseudomonadota bacterium]
MTFDDATRAQVTAARPDASTWLGANAGSGKTRVLTDRVARLLLNDTQPQRILCLTYTKAAASEMQNRLFKRLGAWAMLDNDSLRDALMELGIEGAFDEARLRKARTLFAMAIETPGGLKIQTIHSFCASLLRRFPLESGVSPQFTEIEERAAELLRAEILDQMAEGEDASIVAEIARHHTDESLDGLAQAIVGMRDDFASPAQLKDFLEALDLPRDVTRESIMAKTMLGSEDSLIHGLIPRLLASSTNDIKVGKRLQALGAVCWDSLPELESVFLFGKDANLPFGAKIGKFPTKPVREVLGANLDELNALMQRVEAARPMRLGLIAAERSAVLHAFGCAFLKRYENAKKARGWLDFDDLITKARALLIDKEVATWVLYRIDGGIDHI